MYRYDNFGDLNFDYFRSYAGFFRYLPYDKGTLSALFGNGFLFAHYAYYNVSDGLFGSGSFSNHSAILGFQKAMPIIRGHQVYYGAVADLSFESNGPFFQRNEYRMYTGYSVEWTENLLSHAGYVASLFDYVNTSQQDWIHNIEADAYFIIARPMMFKQESEIYIKANAIFNLNDSNEEILDYKYFNWGGGIGIRSSF